MMSTFAFHGECFPLARAIVKRPQEAFTSQFIINTRWEIEQWLAAPDYNRAAEQHFQFLKKLGVPARFQPEDFVHSLTSIYLRDAALITPDGKHITMRIQATDRAGEPHECSNYLDQLGIEPLGQLTEPAVANGSDFYWLNQDLLVAALTEFTNEQGIEQVHKLLRQNAPTAKVEIIKVNLTDLPSNAKTRCHLVSATSLIKRDLIVLCPDRFPAGFVTDLEDRGYQIIPVTIDEWNCGAAEILPLNESRCFMNEEGDASKQVAEKLKAAGQKVEMVSIPALRLGKGGLVSMLICCSRLRE